MNVTGLDAAAATAEPASRLSVDRLRRPPGAPSRREDSDAVPAAALAATTSRPTASPRAPRLRRTAPPIPKGQPAACPPRRLAAGGRDRRARPRLHAASSTSTPNDIELRHPQSARRCRPGRARTSTSPPPTARAINDWQVARLDQAASRACAPRSSCRYEDAAGRGRRDRALRRRPALRPGAPADAAPPSRSATAATGRSTRRRPSGRPAGRHPRLRLRRPRRSPRAAGPPTTSRR